MRHQQMAAARQAWELEARPETVVYVDVDHRALGTASVGLDPAPEFKVGLGTYPGMVNGGQPRRQEVTSIPHGADAQPSNVLGEAPIVHTPAGDVSGVLLDNGQAAYLGIPYAEPPVGALRFALPVKRAPWGGVRNCTRYGATPLRGYMDPGGTFIPEPAFPGDDTLAVNVFAPAGGGEGLPVWVWFHGGGFITGSPSSQWYDGGAFPRDGVIVVPVGYRLGLDGFGVMDEAPDNRAVHDWILALEWVRDSIAHFGGDPTRVTIGGQSAGATAALTLLSMPSVQHLFTAVVAESPCTITGDRKAIQARTAALAKRLGIKPWRAAFATFDERTIFTEQQKMTDEEFGSLQFVRGIVRGKTAMGWSPVVGTGLIPYRVEHALARGIGADKRMLIGSVANEIDFHMQTLPKAVDRLPRQLALIAVGLRPKQARAYARRIPGTVREILGRVLSDSGFRLYTSRVLAVRDGAPTYAYDFRMPSAGTGLASHCIEMPFVWDCLDANNVVSRNTGVNPPQSLAGTVHGAWVSFIAGAEPGSQAYGSSSKTGILLERTSRVAPVFVRESELI